MKKNMKTIVAKLINLVNNHMAFCLGLLVAALTLGVLDWWLKGASVSEAAGMATVFTGMILGIRFLFSYCLSRITEEYRNDPWGRKVLSSLMWGFIIFLTGPIVAIFKEFITNDFWYGIISKINLWIGYLGMIMVGFAFFIGLLYGISCLWQSLVKWANS